MCLKKIINSWHYFQCNWNSALCSKMGKHFDLRKLAKYSCFFPIVPGTGQDAAQPAQGPPGHDSPPWWERHLPGWRTAACVGDTVWWPQPEPDGHLTTAPGLYSSAAKRTVRSKNRTKYWQKKTPMHLSNRCHSLGGARKFIEQRLLLIRRPEQSET